MPPSYAWLYLVKYDDGKIFGPIKPPPYEPFLKLAEEIFNQTRAIFSDKNNHDYPARLYENNGDTVLKSRHSYRKPDALALPADYDFTKKITWKDVSIPFEFKTNTRANAKGRALFRAEILQEVQEATDDILGGPVQTAAAIRSVDRGAFPVSRGRLQRKRTSAVNLNAPTSPAMTSLDSVKGRLRKRDSKGDNLNEKHGAGPDASVDGSPLKRRVDDDSGIVPSKRQRTRLKLTEDQLQLARYALECMAACSRHYVTGVFIDGFDISLWYYDRAIVARTAFFDLRKDVGLFALVIYAIRYCDLRHAGFDAFIIPPSTSPPSNLAELFKIPPSMMQSKGDEIVLFPQNDVKRFRIDEDGVLFANKGLIGRGTVVFSVVPIGDNATSEGKQVVKILWRQKKRKEESDIIQQLRKAIPAMKQHLPELTAFVSVTAAELNLPRQLLRLSYDDDWERELLMIAMKRYKGLWYAKDVDEFKDIFVDCVECHYASFHQGRILHRDLSVDNLMCDDGPKRNGKLQRQIGIVSDWDLASLIDDKGAIILSHTKHRTGTIPFMSKELLDQDLPAHKYWNDLESFLYILFWAAVHFDLEKHTVLPTHELLKSWNHDDLSICSGQKKLFFAHWKESGYYDLVRPENARLVDWIIALKKLFSDTYSNVQVGQKEIFDSKTCDLFTHRPVELFEQKITFRSFMAAIGRQPRYLYE
ncbi:hypothetical protein M378DRAFT_198649 [Amanita muscaria Koide BX008]|uniref:Cytochrome c domain-containing protein n=1 Tax=Amanita muscaria (strain Koide BX008) TaxID=946122 RepID=A0A0C2X3Z6_AMAMK|nr:hypothetical protein M378DRAFT_198649 [Amanita muscaria Koide BX008]